MRRTVYEVNYEKILPLLSDYRKIQNKGFEDLVIEKIGDNEYSIAHYYKQNGDLMRDPEMTVRIFPDLKMVEALTYQMDCFGTYQEVYLEAGKYYPQLKKELNKFLGQWLTNLKNQGFYRLIA
jgi:hypothetical protein